MLDEGLNKRKDRVAKAVAGFTGFVADMTAQEEEDMAIEKAQLELDKERELKSVEV